MRRAVKALLFISKRTRKRCKLWRTRPRKVCVEILVFSGRWKKGAPLVLNCFYSVFTVSIICIQSKLYS